MTIDTSLDTLMLPALPTYQNEFGTKKLNGGLTTAECTDGVMIWGRRQRPFLVTETSETTKVEANCTFEVTTAGIELTIADATFAGCEAKVINASDGTITVKGGVSGLNGSSDAVTIPPRAMLFLTFFEGWITSNSTYSGSDEVSDFEKRIFLAAHPPTTLYWTSDPRNPGDVYGGTWTQIKDRFVLAAGDTYTNGATGGNADTTLTIENLPSHTHGLNNHTHSFTPKGSVSSHRHGVGTLATSSTGSHNHRITIYTGESRTGISNIYGHNTDSSDARNYWCIVGNTVGDIWNASDDTSVVTSKTETAGYARYANWGGKRNNSYKRSIIESDGAHTHPITGYTEYFTPLFTGTQGTTGAANGNTTATGSGTKFSNMPPYIGKYCWERVA